MRHKGDLYADVGPASAGELKVPQIVRPVRRFSQQYAQSELRWTPQENGNPVGEYYCLPTAFYALALANGYWSPQYRNNGADKGSPGDQGLAEYTRDVDRRLRDSNSGWSRPAMSREMRGLFDGMPVVSWQYSAGEDVDSFSDVNLLAMRDAGYIKTQYEVEFLRGRIVNHTIAEIVQHGYPVMVTVKPGFAANKADHTVVVDGWSDAGVHIVDSDERNPYELYAPEAVSESLTGACTVIPPFDEYPQWPGMGDWLGGRWTADTDWMIDRGKTDVG